MKCYLLIVWTMLQSLLCSVCMTQRLITVLMASMGVNRSLWTQKIPVFVNAEKASYSGLIGKLARVSVQCFFYTSLCSFQVRNSRFFFDLLSIYIYIYMRECRMSKEVFKQHIGRLSYMAGGVKGSTWPPPTVTTKVPLSKAFNPECGCNEQFSGVKAISVFLK